jgi:hypothetical protein
MLLPAGTIYCGTHKHHSSIGEVQNAYRFILTQAGKIGNIRRMFVACGRQAIPPLAQAEGLSGLFSVKAPARPL